MRKLKVYYATVDNMGDKLNGYLMNRLFGREIERRTPLTCELSGIGSGLGQFTYSSQRWLHCAEHITGKIWRETFVWGTGFIEQKIDAPFYRSGMEFCAVRGMLSKQRVERLLGHPIDAVLGDGGILVSCTLEKAIPKKYPLGIIAHYKEQNVPLLQTLREKFPKALYIDVRESPEKVIRKIAACDCIVSSSLHGLIVADSFHIPNLHIQLSDEMLGDGFKFKDYYSSYGLADSVLDLRKESMVSVYDIYDKYCVTPQMVEKQKKDMFQAFPFR